MRLSYWKNAAVSVLVLAGSSGTHAEDVGATVSNEGPRDAWFSDIRSESRWQPALRSFRPAKP